MISGNVVPMQTGVPGWLALAVVVARIALAILTGLLMLLRLRPATDEDTRAAPSALRDPVLILAVAGVIVLAAAAWMLR